MCTYHLILGRYFFFFCILWPPPPPLLLFSGEGARSNEKEKKGSSEDHKKTKLNWDRDFPSCWGIEGCVCVCVCVCVRYFLEGVWGGRYWVWRFRLESCYFVVEVGILTEGEIGSVCVCVCVCVRAHSCLDQLQGNLPPLPSICLY